MVYGPTFTVALPCRVNTLLALYPALTLLILYPLFFTHSWFTGSLPCLYSRSLARFGGRVKSLVCDCPHASRLTPHQLGGRGLTLCANGCIVVLSTQHRPRYMSQHPRGAHLLRVSALSITTQPLGRNVMYFIDLSLRNH